MLEQAQPERQPSCHVGLAQHLQHLQIVCLSTSRAAGSLPCSWPRMKRWYAQDSSDTARDAAIVGLLPSSSCSIASLGCSSSGSDASMSSVCWRSGCALLERQHAAGCGSSHQRRRSRLCRSCACWLPSTGLRTTVPPLRGILDERHGLI